MPRPKPSFVAREDVAASFEELSCADALPSGKTGMTVGTEGEMLARDEEEEEEEWVSVDAMIDIVIGDSVDNVLGLVVVSGCKVVADSSVLIDIVSDQAPLHVGGVTGVTAGRIDAVDELVVLTHELY